MTIKTYHLTISINGFIILIIGYYNKNHLCIGYGLGIFIMFLYEFLIMDTKDKKIKLKKNNKVKNKIPL